MWEIRSFVERVKRIWLRETCLQSLLTSHFPKKFIVKFHGYLKLNKRYIWSPRVIWAPISFKHTFNGCNCCIKHTNARCRTWMITSNWRSTRISVKVFTGKITGQKKRNPSAKTWKMFARFLKTTYPFSNDFILTFHCSRFHHTYKFSTWVIFNWIETVDQFIFSISCLL